MQDDFDYIPTYVMLGSGDEIYGAEKSLCVCECTLQWRRPTVVPRYLSPQIGSPTYGRASGRYYIIIAIIILRATGGPAAVVR